MTLLLESFGAFDTALLPAAGRWTTATGVVISPGAGRSGDADDNAAFFDTSLGSVLSRTLTPAAVAGVYTATYGQAVRILNLGVSVVLATIETAISTFDLILTNAGVVKLTQTTNSVLLGTICESTAGVVPRGTGGCYVEVTMRFVAGQATACQIRISDQFTAMNVVAQGPLLALGVGDLPYTTFRLGGGVGDEPATWYVTDVYLNDGVPVVPAIPWAGTLISNNGYFGNTKVDTLFATADGLNLSVGNTPWTPNSGAVGFSRINEHPPDEDASYVSAEDADQRSTFVFATPRGSSFGLIGCSGTKAPLYALQWSGRMRVESITRTVAPVIRRIVTGLFAGDIVSEGTGIDVEDTDYLYFQQVFQRNPTLDDVPWSFDVFNLVSVVDSTEFGVALL